MARCSAACSSFLDRHASSLIIMIHHSLLYHHWLYFVIIIYYWSSWFIIIYLISSSLNIIHYHSLPLIIVKRIDAKPFDLTMARLSAVRSPFPDNGTVFRCLLVGWRWRSVPLLARRFLRFCYNFIGHHFHFRDNVTCSNIDAVWRCRFYYYGSRQSYHHLRLKWMEIRG